jgi:hypothetical protein
MAGVVAHMLGINAAAGGGGGTPTPVTRQIYSSEVAGPVNNTDATTPTSLVTLTFTPDASATYAIFWSAEFSFNVAANMALIVYEAGVESLRAFESPKELGAPIDYKQRGGFLIHAAGGSPSSTTWEIKVVRTGGSGTASAKNGRLVAVRLESFDHYAESLGADSQTGTTYLDKASTTFDAGTAQDYLVIGSGIQEPSSGNATRSRLSDGTNATYVVEFHGGASQLFPFGIAWVRTGLSGSVTFKTQFSAHAAGVTCATSNNRILALALGSFHDNYNTTLGSSSAGTDIAYTDALTMTDTPAAADHLEVACWHARSSGTTITAYTQFRDDATTISENVVEVPSATSGRGMSCFVVKAVTYAAASRTWDIQRKSETNTLTTTVDAGACIAVLQVEP